ncbi:MAG TPA: ChbG/HpnK family deacetylase, partial [Xanthobacteraceae bacterium]|nr:ChbG/HpnK family deacetylase [Xanthobacteraceae bacterium]
MQPTGARPRSEYAARRLWLCADDYGIAPGVNAAIRDLIGKRRLNATSVMVVAPSFNQEAAHALRELAQPAEVAIGLHITLTAPYRPLTSSYKPVRKGLFLSLRHTFVRALVRRLDTAALAAEIAAQFDAFTAAFGRPPAFVDGHQHVHLLPQVRTAVLTAIAARAPGAWAR